MASRIRECWVVLWYTRVSQVGVKDEGPIVIVIDDHKSDNERNTAVVEGGLTILSTMELVGISQKRW